MATSRTAARLATPSRELVEVSPALAKQWLALTGPNRPVQQATVERFAADMREQAWHLNGDPVRFDEAGALRDGQHRLLAVTLSGATVPMELVRGLSEEAVRTVDTGRARSFSDALAIDNLPNARTLAATAKWVWRYEHDLLQGPSRQPSHAELRETLERHPGMADALREVQRSKEFQPHSAIALVYGLAKEHMPRKAVQWLEGLHDGENLTKTSPLWHLRRKLGSRQALARGLRPIEVAALAAKAWNAFAANEQMTSLTWTDSGSTAEPFPLIR